MCQKQALVILAYIYERRHYGHKLAKIVGSENGAEEKHPCYAQDERMVRLGAFECEGGSSGVYLATAVSGDG